VTRRITEIRNVPRLPVRRHDAHKGDFGRILVVAGSPGMCGAAILAARAALRAGAGLVTVAIPASLSTALAVAVPEATQLVLPEPADADHAARADSALAPAVLAGFDVAAIGPGLGTGDASRRVVAVVLERFAGPQVVDADALNLVATGVLVTPRSDRVFTPHPGEFERLTAERPRDEAARVEACERFATRRGGVIVLKGHRSVVHDGERYSIELGGNPGMASGGSGDALTGVIAALLGQGLGAFDAARLGVFLHARAGDLAARRFGAPSLIASDLVDCLPDAFRRHASP